MALWNVSGKLPSPSAHMRDGMNANVHLRVTVEVSISEERLDHFYPKVRHGLRKVWEQNHVK